jgi:uncharacterized membrane protein YsdA (DUF1294 family)
VNDVVLYILSYLLAINLFGFILMGWDKLKAKRRAFRIPEATLFAVAVFGGSLGAWLGMYCFRHKTERWFFVYGIPTVLTMQVIGVLMALYYYQPIIF